MRLLLDVNRLAQELTKAAPDSEPQRPQRINLGIYLFDEEDRPAAGDDRR